MKLLKMNKVRIFFILDMFSKVFFWEQEKIDATKMSHPAYFSKKSIQINLLIVFLKNDTVYMVTIVQYPMRVRGADLDHVTYGL